MDKYAYRINTVNMERKHTSGIKVSFDPKVKKMIDDLSTLLDVKITFFTLDKEESLVGYHSSESDFCSLLQQNLNITSRCNRQDDEACKLCKERKETIIYRCHAGLTEIMLPIKNKELFAFAIVGQFRMDDSMPESILKEWKAKGFDESVLKKTFFERPFYNQEKAQSIASLFQAIIELQVKTDSLRMKRPELLDKIYSYIEENIASPITLEDISKELSRSPSLITHRVKQSTGKSFKELLIDKRLDCFEAVIREDPDIGIREASSQIGYQDSLYLSRLYKKKRGITPAEYRNAIRLELNLKPTLP